MATKLILLSGHQALSFALFFREVAAVRPALVVLRRTGSVIVRYIRGLARGGRCA